MATPAFVAHTFAVVMVGVSLYCIARLMAARRWDREKHAAVTVSHMAMGLGMAGMLVPRLDPLPSAAWEAIFAAVAVWFSAQTIRVLTARSVAAGAGGANGIRPGRTHGTSHYLIHLAMALGMLYMYLAAVPAGGAGTGETMAGASGAAAGVAALPLLFVIILFASAVWQLDGMSRFAPAQTGLVSAGVSPAPGAAQSSSSAGAPAAPPGASPSASASGSEGRQMLAPRLEMACHVAMCLTMGFMLVLML